MKNFKPLLLILLLTLMLVLSVTGCDRRTTDLPGIKIVSMTANPTTIYADNNITYSTIRVMVKDEEDFAVTSEPVTFRSNIGSLIKNTTTDSMGVAETFFWDSGDIGLATIEAFVADERASVQVMIDSIPNIVSLNFTQIPNALNIDDITTIKAKGINEIGNVPDGTMIFFETDLGFFQSVDGVSLGNVASDDTQNGVAQVVFNAGTLQGEATIVARIGTIYTEGMITIHPGSPRYMYLYPEVLEVQANSGQSVEIMTRVEDKYHNPVENGVGVSYTTTLGTVNPNGNTDSLGIAYTNFSPGVTAGIAQIDAVADSATARTFITVVSDDVHSIVFDFSGIIGIQVQGTGGQESYELSVSLKDMSGNLITNDVMVHFELLNYPNGTNINNIGPADSTMSVNGHAIVSINSGSEAGVVRIKAYAYNQEGNEISAIKSGIVVHAGPPNSASFSLGGYSQGQNMGGGIWKVQVAALISDMYGNPVDQGIAVFFSLPDDPDFASIEAAAYVGNENANGDSLAGTAFTYLTYDGVYTNEVIDIQVEVGGFDTYPGSVVLPIQFPVIDMVPVPQHVDWVNAGDNQPKSTQIRITIRDGQNNAIDNQVVTFYTTLGTPLAPTPPDTGDPNTGLTGVVDGEHGRLNKTIQFQKYECPAPTPAGPGTTTATITAHILGTTVNNTASVILFRYTD
ncbi:MAG: hypothetical protein JW784_02250 [Candidatus Cloacimonetes bacterium]|nr:hypothetical protein [Candidatus Cloacimonadota bacterium]